MKKIFTVFLCVISFHLYAQTKPTATSVTAGSFVLNWGAIVGANSNTIQVASDPSYTHIIVSLHPSPIASGGNRIFLGLTPGTTYYFKQFGTTVSRTGITGEFSLTGSVTLLPTPPAPTNVVATPFEYGDGTQAISLTWSGPGASAYVVEYSVDPGFSANLLLANNTSSPSLMLDHLLSNTIYFIRVRSTSGGISSPNSTVQQIALPSKLPTGLFSSPIGSDSVALFWSPVANVNQYAFDVSSDSTFSTGNVYLNSTVSGTRQTVMGLTLGRVYYFRVRSISSHGAGPSKNSSVQSFLVPPAIIDPPAQFSPALAGGDPGADPFRLNVIPPSPEAAALARYADIPVSLYSGTPSISIPLYDLKVRGLSLPISLSYQATGHKVETVAPRTGLGWVLNAGGAVTRVVRGWPDEHLRGWLRINRPFNTISEIASKSDFEKYLIYNPIAEGCVDSEPDLFYFNFAGYTGQFMYDADRTLKIVSGNSIKIEPMGLDLNDTLQVHYIQGWTVTVDDGTVFTFQATETTNVSSPQFSLNPCARVSEGAADEMPQSWFLTEMRSADQQSWIHFDYTGYSQFNNYVSLETEVRDPNSSTVVSADNQETLGITNFGVNLRRITVSSGQSVIDFLPSGTARGDVTTNPDNPSLNNNFALGQINVSNINGRQIEHWDFQYSYKTNRLTLESLTESANGIAKPPYHFTYSHALVNRTSFARDHWGFNNNNTANTLLPATTMILIGKNVPLTGADRSPSGAVLNGMLSQITYPTGGTDVFTFEPHDYSFEQRQELIMPVITPGTKSVSAFTQDDVGQTFASHSVNFTITAPSASEQTEVTIKYFFDLSYTGPSGGTYTPYASITDSKGKVLDQRSQAPQNQSTESISTLKLKPGTYTITASQNIPNIKNPNSDSGGNSLTVEADWNTDTGQKFTDVRPGGGVRIQKIVRSFGNGNPDKVTKYDYTYKADGQLKSTGSLLESGYVYEYDTDFALANGGTITQDNTITAFFRFSQNRSALGTTQGSHVGYDQVTVLYGEYGENGRSVYRYDSPREIDDGTSFTAPFPPPVSFDYQRGLLKEQVDFAAHSNDTLRVVKNEYHFVQQSVTGLKIGWNVINAHVRGAQYLNIYAIGGYDTNLGYGRLVDTRERVFNNGVPVETHITQQYAENTHKQLITSAVTDSKGDTYVTSQKYPQDYGTSNSAINVMKTLHIDNVPIEKLTWKQGTGSTVSLLSGLKTDFIPTNGVVVPQLKSSAKIATPVSTTDPFGAVQSLYEGRLSYKSFDGYFNVKQVSLVDGMNTTYIWGYSATLPVAKVDNATTGQVFYESFEETTGGSVTTAQSRTGKQSLSLNSTYSVPSASLPTVSGNYVLSYWAFVGSHWTYNEKQISNYIPGTFITTDVINGMLDEVRVYPDGALMTTYTYEPLLGLTSVTDPGNTTVHYEYDGLGRLAYIKDLNGNVVEAYTYQYLQNVPFPSGN